jgi:hypothetical protein
VLGCLTRQFQFTAYERRRKDGLNAVSLE